MTVVLDANILVRSADRSSPDRQDALDAIEALRNRTHHPVIVPQSIYEFWSVATRPAEKNGLGRTPDEATVEVAYFKSEFALLPDVPAIFAEWERLVVAHQVSGKPSHDARYVAAMLAHGVPHFLTFNDADFRRFPEIAVLTPAAVLAAP